MRSHGFVPDARAVLAAPEGMPTAGGGSMQATDPTPGVLVAGAGNALLACDRIGPMVLEAIGDRYGGDVELCDIGCTALALLDHLDGQDLLVVIDACIGRGEPGDVFTVEPDLDALLAPGTSAHQVGPVEALVVARHLWPERLPKRVVLLLAETGAIDEATEAAAFERVIKQLDREIDDWRRRRGGVPAVRALRLEEQHDR